MSIENPHGYWCRECGRSRVWVELRCSSAYCKESRDREDRDARRADEDEDD